ncbi:ribonuclease E inhibitor RraB [Verrucomicrobiaceae bacterium N1E253]|uniref:Ribonuclease E inhibitor RraB n=1 Tax=Oceaniferula marina TaxID=2748318 RepID=A0A851GKU9_9BACT|nr:ribonuclease E inhibitor RraB [Oceaniferula marina]NWK57759.1 ribonuclease E inhibitor RraB [Oceaniferula marina]
MKIVEQLLINSEEDTKLLIQNDSHGDKFSVPRTVDFTINASDEEKAELVASFIEDNHYGKTTVTKVDEVFRISVFVEMPIEQNIICSVSGLMLCVSELFNVDYDGWGCIMQNKA